MRKWTDQVTIEDPDRIFSCPDCRALLPIGSNYCAHCRWVSPTFANGRELRAQGSSGERVLAVIFFLLVGVPCGIVALVMLVSSAGIMVDLSAALALGAVSALSIAWLARTYSKKNRTKRKKKTT